MTLPRKLPPTLALGLTLAFRSFAALLLVVKLGQVQRKRATGIRPYVLADTHQRLAAFVKHVLQANDDALKVHLTALLDVVAHFSQIDF